MKITVVSTTKNEENNITEFLESLVKQEKKPYEVIIVDSDSNDKTCEIINKYSKKYNYIKLFNHPGTRSKSMNYGIKKSTGDAIAFLGGDDVVDKTWIKEIEKSMKNNDIVVGKIISMKKGKRKNIENVKLFHKGVNISYPGTNTMYKKEVLDKIGGFDTWFLSSEDLEINYRAVDAGYKIVYNDKIKIYYRPKGSFFSFVKQSFWYGYGRKLLDIKHGSILKKHSIIDTLKTQVSMFGILRLFLGFVGYSYCILSVRKYDN